MRARFAAALLLLVLCAAAVTAADDVIIIHQNKTRTPDEEISVDVGDHKWTRPWGVIVAAVVLFVLAVLSPIAVPKLISMFIESHIKDNDRSLAHGDATPYHAQAGPAYGTFDDKHHHHHHKSEFMKTPVVHSHALEASDLPPSFKIRWDRSAWKLIHRYLDVPFALAVSAALLSLAIGVLQLPQKWDIVHLRHVANTVTQLFLIATAVFALHRFVELVIEFVERQAWLARTHMQKMYEEIAGKVGVVVKIVGTMVIVVSILGLTNEEGWSQQILFAFVTATVVVLVGWVFMELSDTATEFASAATIMSINMFAVGDEIECFFVDNGPMQGTVKAIDTRVMQLVKGGQVMIVPNVNILKSAVINVTRSLPLLQTTVYIQSSLGTDKMRAMVEGARKIARDISVPGSESSVYYHGIVTSETIPLLLTAFIAPNANVAVMRTNVMMQLMDLARSLDISLEMK